MLVATYPVFWKAAQVPQEMQNMTIPRCVRPSPHNLRLSQRRLPNPQQERSRRILDGANLGRRNLYSPNPWECNRHRRWRWARLRVKAQPGVLRMQKAVATSKAWWWAAAL